MSSQDWFLHSDNAQVRTKASDQLFLPAKGGPDDSPPYLFAGPGPSGLLSLPKGEGRTSWPLADPEELGGGVS